MKDKEDQIEQQHQEHTLDQLVTCPLCQRLLVKPHALPCGVCCACHACIGEYHSSACGGDSLRCHCHQEVARADMEAAQKDPTREHLVRLYAQLLSQGQQPNEETDTTKKDPTMEAETMAEANRASSRFTRSPVSREIRLAALERRLCAWERAHRTEEEAAEAALDGAERAIAEARLRLAEVANAGREALEAARLRVRVARESKGEEAGSAEDPQLPLLPPPPGQLTRWAADLTGHVSSGLQEAASLAATSCRPTELPLIARHSFALAGYSAVAACGIACTDGFHCDAGGRVFEASVEAASGVSAVGVRPLPPTCVAVLIRRHRRQLFRREKRHQMMLQEKLKPGAEEQDTKILFLACPGNDDSLSSVPIIATPITSMQGSLPLRLTGNLTLAQLFLLTTALRGRQRQLLVSQCGLDGRSVQSAELRDFWRNSDARGASACADRCGEPTSKENWRKAEDTEEEHCYEDIRIESNSKHVVVFSGGSAASAGTSVVVLLDLTSLRIVQRLRLPDGSMVLHATPGVVWMRHAGRVKLVSQASRQVGRDWPEERLGGLFYATDVADADGGLVVATENCVRLFDRELQPLCRIAGSSGQGYRLQHPVAVCRVRCGGIRSSALAVCDAASNEVLIFGLE